MFQRNYQVIMILYVPSNKSLDRVEGSESLTTQFLSASHHHIPIRSDGAYWRVVGVLYVAAFGPPPIPRN